MTRRRWLLTATGGAAFASAAVASGSDPAATVRLLVLGLALGALVARDLSERRIPNRIVLPATALCMLLDATTSIAWRALATSLAIVTTLFILALARPHAVGMGDVKLALLIAVGLPTTAAVAALMLGLLIAATWGVVLAAARRRPLHEIALPLAPFLAIATLTVLA